MSALSSGDSFSSGASSSITFLYLAQAQVAIGQQEDRLPVGRLLLDRFGQFFGGGGESGRSCSSARAQVHADRQVARFEFQRLPVLDDGGLDTGPIWRVRRRGWSVP